MMQFPRPVLWLVAFLSLLVAGTTWAALQAQEPPTVEDREATFDFRTPQMTLQGDGAASSMGGLIIPGRSLEGSIESDPIPVTLDSADPFLTVGTIWMMPSLADDLTISMRGSRDGETWGEWQKFDELLYTGYESELASDLVFFDPDTRYVQYQIAWSRPAAGDDTVIQSLRVLFISPGSTPEGAAQPQAVDEASGIEVVAQAVTKPSVVSRTGWGCPTGQSAPDWAPEYTTVTHLIVHHTSDGSPSSDYPAVVRAIWDFHTNVRGWGDIGYNYLIDPNGVIYEGRAGGDNVIGAHFSCVNGGTMGVAFMGNFSSTSPTSAARQSLERILAWKASQNNLSATGSGYHNSSQLTLMTISGHRDAGTSPVGCGGTTCPGDTLYGLLPSIRTNVSNLVATSAIPQNQQLLINGNFDSGNTNGWTTSSGVISPNVTNGVFRWYRASGGSTASIAQNTGYAVQQNTPFEVNLMLGNTSGVTKQLSVSVRNSSTSSGQIQCTFNLPPNAPLRSYVVRGRTGVAFNNAQLSIASLSADGQAYHTLDNVDLRYRPDIAISSTTCIYPPPGTPTIAAPSNGEVITNANGYVVRLNRGVLSGRPGEVTDYFVRIDDDPTFASPEFSSGWTTNPNITINRALPDGVYYVRAQQGDGAQGSGWVTSAFVVHATPLTLHYEANFESTVGSEWSRTTTSTTPMGGRRFLGEFGNQTARLILNSLPAHSAVYVTFDAYLIKTWDGNDGPDRFTVSIAGGETLLNSTFSNRSHQQAYPGAAGASYPARTGTYENNRLGYGDDAVYRLGFAFNHSASSLRLNFAASGLGSISDESWGIDNVRVYLDTRLGNDDFAGAEVISSLPATINQTNVRDATRAASDPTNCAGVLDHTLWFRYQPPRTQSLIISTAGSSYNTVLGVYRGSEGSLTTIGCNNNADGSTSTSSLTFTAFPDTTYHILIGSSGALGSPATLSLNVSASNILASPLLRAPANDESTTDSTPLFQWYGVEGAVSYEIALGRTTAPTDIVFSGTALQFSPSSPLLPTTYYWRARTVRGDGARSAWSTARTVNITSDASAVPQLNFVELASYTLTWNRLTWATGYELHVGRDSSFAGGSYNTYMMLADELSVSLADLDNGTYYWRVRGRRADGTSGSWSAVGSFVIDVP